MRSRWGEVWDARPMTGRLLVATPGIGGGIFERSVVLVLQHETDSGAQGVVLNSPLEAPVEAVLPGWQDVLTEPDRLFQGGPVQLDSALGLVGFPRPEALPVGVRPLFGRVGVIDLDTPPALVNGALAAMRVFAGYAGWEAGQLEDEIAQGGWFVVDAAPDDPFTNVPAGMWRRVLRRQHSEVAYVSTYPTDPDSN